MATPLSAVLPFWNFEKHRQKYRVIFDFQVPVPPVSLTKYRVSVSLVL